MKVPLDMLRAYAAAGLTVAEAAANLGLAIHQVRYYARKHGIRFRHGSKKIAPDARAEAMRDAYLAGRTLTDIGEEFGVTRERVRQIITKYFGRLAQEGGGALRARLAKEKRLAVLDAEARSRWGCTRQQYGVLRRMGEKLMARGVSRERTPIGAFARQRCTAKTRSISWEMTLWEWWTIWQRSGKWSRRGRERGQFVMCRFGDTGPYSANNVFIALNCENISAATRKDDLPVGVQRAGTRYEAGTVIRGKYTVLGRFDTPQDAHIAYLRSLRLEAA